jgi:nucleoside 2-deoxyribosyltransferase
MTKLYLAGPLFTEAERNFNSWLASQLRAKGFEIFLPQEQEQHATTARLIFEGDVGGIKWCDVLVANMDGADPDSGTSFEVGMACGLGKPIVLYRTDIREEGPPFGPYNLMMHQAANRVLNCKWMDRHEIAGLIADAAARPLDASKGSCA